MCAWKAKRTGFNKINERADFDLFKLHDKIQMETKKKKRKKKLISSSCSHINLQSKIPKINSHSNLHAPKVLENEIPLTIPFHFYFQESLVCRDFGFGDFCT